MSTPYGPSIAIFFRDDCWYTIEFCGAVSPEQEAADHAALNPGTSRVETIDGKVLWQEPVQ